MTYEITRQREPERHLAVTRFTAGAAQISARMGAAFGTVYGYLGRNGLQPLGPPVAYFTLRDDAFDVCVGCVVTTPISADGDLEPFDVPAGETLTTLHVGPYDELSKAYDALGARARELGLRLDPAHMWEEYLTGPEVPAAEQRTEIHWPISPQS